MTTLKTKRLILRPWRQEDLEPFAALNACEKVCEHLPATLTKHASNELAHRIMNEFQKNGYGLFAVERQDTEDFIGFTGLHKPNFEAHFMPAIEIGWRLSHSNWGQGFATEAARAVLNYAFDELQLNEIVSFTTKANMRSRNVMQKLGLTRDPKDDFLHPNLPKDHPLAKHVLYRRKKPSDADTQKTTK